MSSQDNLKSVFAEPEVPRYLYDSSLLFSCMQSLQIDRHGLEHDDPLLYRESQGVCALCPSKAVCVQDTAQRSDEALSEKWEKYCPNAPTLDVIGAVQNCGRAAQYFKMSRGVIASHLG